MLTLIIYDTTGYPIQIMSGDVREPVGVPFMWIEVPEGKQVTGVDVSGEQHEAILEDLPKTTEDEINELKQSIAELTILIATQQT